MFLLMCTLVAAVAFKAIGKFPFSGQANSPEELSAPICWL